MQPFLSVVVPAFNEAQRLPRTLYDISAFLAGQGYPSEIIVVDDGSVDGTALAVEEFSRHTPSVSLIRNQHRGKANTVRTGMLVASGQYVLFTDADNATPIQEWRKLQPLLEQGYDVAIGSREGVGARRYDEPWHRHLMGRVFNLIVQSLLIPGIQDTQCGFKAFRRSAAQDLFGSMRLYGDDTQLVQGAMLTGFDVEVLFMARKWGYRIAEVPVVWHYGKESKVSAVRDSWRNLRDVLRVRWNDFRGKYDRS